VNVVQNYHFSLINGEGWKATVITAKAIALTAYDLLTRPAKVKEIQDKFKELKAREGKLIISFPINSSSHFK